MVTRTVPCQAASTTSHRFPTVFASGVRYISRPIMVLICSLKFKHSENILLTSQLLRVHDSRCSLVYSCWNSMEGMACINHQILFYLSFCCQTINNVHKGYLLLNHKADFSRCSSSQANKIIAVSTVKDKFKNGALQSDPAVRGHDFTVNASWINLWEVSKAIP